MPRTDDAIDVHTRLLNWGRWARGGIPELGEEQLGMVDELDAEVLEVAVLTAKMARPRYYRYVRRRYLYGWGEPALCAEFRCGSTSLLKLAGQTLAYVQAVLDYRLQSALNERARLDAAAR